MKKPLLALALGIAASSQAFTPMNQVDPSGSTNANLLDSNTFDVIQIIGDIPAFSSTVIDDFVLLGTKVVSVSVVCEVSNPTAYFLVPHSWQVSFWQSPFKAALTDGMFASQTVPGGSLLATQANSTITYTPLAGTGVTNAYRVDVTFNTPMVFGLLLGTNLWFGMATVADFGAFGQVFILKNNSPACLPGGSNCLGLNPGGGFGSGVLFPAGYNAAYRVDTL